MGVRLVVSVTRPEEELEHLALLLAESLASQELHQRQAEEYTAAAHREQQKANNLREVLEKLQRGDYKPTRRMDPYATYDPSAVFAEMEQADSRADDFLDMAADFRRRLQEAREEQDKVQRKIQQVRAQMRRE